MHVSEHPTSEPSPLRAVEPPPAPPRDIRHQVGQTVTEYGIVLGMLILVLATTVLLLEPGVQAVVKAAADRVAGILP